MCVCVECWGGGHLPAAGGVVPPPPEAATLSRRVVTVSSRLTKEARSPDILWWDTAYSEYRVCGVWYSVWCVWCVMCVVCGVG